MSKGFVPALVARCRSGVLWALSAALLTSAAPLSFAQDNTAVSGRTVAQRMMNNQPNQYRGGVGSIDEVQKNMQELFKEIWLDPSERMSSKSELDKWYSPHLRDITIEMGQRIVESSLYRGFAGYMDYEYFCTGACPGCIYTDQHYTGSCCNGPTSAYYANILDTNWKACCVRDGEENDTLEEIACNHPAGDGWAGLFEYYYPTTAIGWEPQRATTMIATKDEIKSCLADSKPLMENAEWVKKSVESGLKAVGAAPSADLAANIQAVIHDPSLHPSDPNLTFTDTLQGGGLTERVNFAAMDIQEKIALAVQFCMHPLQFGKLMNPYAGDTTQLGGGTTVQELARIPIWANYCPKAVKLMTNPDESSKVGMGQMMDGTPTNFMLGMMAYQQDPLYCQKMNATTAPTANKVLRDGALKQGGTAAFTDASTGYSCRTGRDTPNGQLGGNQARMVPLTLYSSSMIDPRNLDHALPFLIAGGYYFGEMAQMGAGHLLSYYKRFEPRPYSKNFKLFSGKQFKGGGINEMGLPCRSYEGANYQNKNQSDQLYLSNKNFSAFTQEVLNNSDSSTEDAFNQYDRHVADQSQRNEFHNRNLDKSVLNYGAAFRIFATCPQGYKRWKGAHSENYRQNCGEEHFGGK